MANFWGSINCGQYATNFIFSLWPTCVSKFVWYAANSLKRNEIVINMIFREIIFFGWYTWFFFNNKKCHCEISLECKGSMYVGFILLIFFALYIFPWIVIELCDNIDQPHNWFTRIECFVYYHRFLSSF